MLKHSPLFIGLRHRFTTPPFSVEDGGAYRVFTRAFDETVNASDLPDVLPKQSPRQLKSLEDAVNSLDSEFSSERIAFGAAAAKLVRDLQESLAEEERTKTVVSFLIDHSGSMQGLRMLSALLAVDVAVDVLMNAGVDTEILGFTTVGWKGGRARHAWKWAGRPPNPGRLCDVRHIIYGAADRPDGLPWHLRFVLRSDLLRENIDGEALEWAGLRLDPGRWDRRIVCVISDGVPMDDSTLQANEDRDLLALHLEAAETKLRSTGIVVGFLLIGRERVREPILYERASEPQTAGLSLLALIRRALMPGSIQVVGISNPPSRHRSALPPVLSPSISAKLSALKAGLALKHSYQELEEILANLSALPASSIVRASREIATKARLGWWQQQTLPVRVEAGSRARVRWWRLKKLLQWSPRRVPSEQELMKGNPDYAWLFLFHPSGYIRAAALDCIHRPPTSPFFFSALAWRLNDWARPVRQAAQRCAERTLPRIPVSVAADAAPYLFDRRIAWGRWTDEPKVLDSVFERDEVMAALALQFRKSSTGPLAARLRHALRYPNVDKHLSDLAAAAVAPQVRAVAYQMPHLGQGNLAGGF
jgi:cobaltochelatase CobT